MRIKILDPTPGSEPGFASIPSFGGKALGDFFLPKAFRAVQVNGEFLDDWLEYRPQGNDDLVLYRNPGFQALVPVLIGAGFLAGTAVSIAQAILFIAPFVLTIGIGFAVSSLVPKPKLGNSSLGGTSAARPEESFGIAGLTNTVSAGTPEFVVYGRRRVYGHLIGSKLGVAPDGKSMSFNVLYFMGDSGGDGYEDVSQVRINRTAIEDIPGASWDWRSGLDTQTVIPGFEQPSQAYFSGLTLQYNTPVIYTTNDSDIRWAKILLQYPTGLRRQKQSDGGIVGGDSQIKVEFKRPADPSWFFATTRNINALSESTLFQEIEIDFGSADQWQIRLTEEFDKDQFSFQPALHDWGQLYNVEERQEGTFTYPGTVLLSVKGIGTEVIRSLAQLECSALVKGKKVKRWTGVGFEGPLWTQQRAWIIRDMLTHPRVGLGHRVDESLFDDDAALDIQNYWDEIVDSFNGEPQEPRDQCDLIVNQKRPGIDWLRDICGEAAAAIIPSGIKLKLIVDRPGVTGILYGMPGNVIEGTIKKEIGYEGKSINRVLGQFPDDDKEYNTNLVEVVDSAIGSDPFKDLQFTYLATVRESDVYRKLTYELKRRILVRRRFTWLSPRAAQVSEPYDLIDLTYQTYQFKRGFSGFLPKAPSGANFWLDRMIELEPSKTYELTVLKQQEPDINEKSVLIISTGPGKHGKIATTGAPSLAHQPNDIWAIGEQAVGLLPILIESTKLANDGRVEVGGREYLEDVYTLDPLPPRSQRRFFRTPQLLPLPFWDVQVSERIVFNPDGSTALVIVFSVTPGLIRSAGTCQAGSATSADLGTHEPNLDDYYIRAKFKIIEGTGAGQEVYATDYIGANRRIIFPTLSTPPDNTSQYEISWDSFEATGGFILEMSLSASGPFSTIADVAGFEYERDGTGTARTEYYRFTPVSIFGRQNRNARWVKQITTTGDQSPPAPPSDVTVQGGVNRVKISWTNPDAIDFSHVQIFRSTTNDSSTASLVKTQAGERNTSNSTVDDQLAGPATYYYWLRSVDFSKNPSAFHAGQFAGEEATTTAGDSDPAPATPTGLALITSGTIGDDGTFYAEIQADWDDNVEVFLGGYHVQIRLSSQAPAWDNVGRIQFAATSFTVLQNLLSNTSYDVRVRAFGRNNNLPSAWSAHETITTSSTPGAPSKPTGLTVDEYPLALVISWNQNPEADIAFYELERDIDNTFSAPVVIVRTQSTSHIDNLPAQTTRWYRVRAFRRTQASTPSNWSDPASGTTNAIEFPDLDPNLKPIEIVSGLPAPGSPGRVVFNTVDNRLYRDTGSGWVLEVPAIDITGQLDETQLTDLSIGAAKLKDNAISGPKLQDDAITETKIADDSISTPKLQALSVSANKIQAGAIETEKLATNAVIADKIAANAITGAKIIANAITAVKIAAGTITGDKIAANAITSGLIQAGAVLASHIGAETINSSHLRTDTIVVSVAAQLASALINTAHIVDAAIKTAKIDDLQVTTLKIGNNAVTNKGENRTSGGSLPDATPTTVASLSLSFSSGTSVLVLGRVSLIGIGLGSVEARLKRDSTVIESFQVNFPTIETYYRLAVLMDLDSPGSGNHTYSIECEFTDEDSGSASAAACELIVTEYLK